MRRADLAGAMASVVDQIVSACEGVGALDRAIEAVVVTIGRSGRKNATSYLEAYRAEMVMRYISEDRRLFGFPRVATPGVHVEVVEVREESRTWEEFEGRLLEKYGHDDALHLSKRKWTFTKRLSGRSTPSKGGRFERRHVQRRNCTEPARMYG
jgi:hypothetical protein